MKEFVLLLFVLSICCFSTPAISDLEYDLSTSSGSSLVRTKPSGLVIAITGATVQTELSHVVYVDDFGADPTGVIDSTDEIQAAITFASSLVASQVDSYGDPVNGCDVIFRGIYKISEPLRVDTSNVCLIGQGGTTIYPYFTSSSGYNGAKPAIIVGTAEGWQNAGSMSKIKYNRIRGINIVRVSGYNSFIGVLVSGTRNAVVSDCLFEMAFCGLYIENTSELYTQQVSTIGCTYGIIGDNRGCRSAANSVLNVACTANDVSNNTFDMITSYYPQHTGVLLINCGTMNFDGMTIGMFSCNPSSSLPLGLPSGPAGFHVLGGNSGNTGWTRGVLANNIVFEAVPSISSDCIRLDSATTSNPILGCTFNNCHVQTYAADQKNSIVTTFVHAIQSGSSEIANTVIRDSGFTFESAGYYYGNMCKVEGRAIVAFDGCYPNTAFASSSLGYFGSIRHTELLERVNIDAFPPSGWSKGGVTTGCSKQGGYPGTISSLKFTGADGAININKQFTYRERISDISSVFISFLARGDAALDCYSTVNGGANSSVLDEHTAGRYVDMVMPCMCQQLIPQPIGSELYFVLTRSHVTMVLMM